MNERTLLVSETQLKAIKIFFDDKTEDILYGWAARWGKSEAIGIILAIVISAFPGSSWLLARTVLADLKATTLATFFKVIKRFGYGINSYKDKIREERHIEFVNESKLFVIQVNLEPWDPEFDRIWSYGYTWWFLDEWQQMSNKVREVLSGRLSELDGSFDTEVPYSYKEYKQEDMNPWWEIKFRVVWQTVRDEDECTIDKKDIIDTVIDNGKICYIIRDEILRIPYKLLESKEVKNKLIHTYAWRFKGCTFTGCNPGTNFTKQDFYIPWKKGTLPSYMDFIPATVNHNPWIDRQYVVRLERLPETSIRKQRLLYGNFDFDDNPGILYDQNTIMDMFDRQLDNNVDDTPYIVVDAARQGKDTTEIGIWKGLHLHTLVKIDKADLVSQAERIEELMGKYGVNNDNVIIDEIWVGWGLVDMLKCKWFIGNSQPLHPYAAKFLSYKKRNYANLRTQAFYYLQKYMSQISITANEETKDLIIEELLTVKEKDVINDSKSQIIPKSEMKEELGRSPDLADCISMRMWWLIKDHHDHPQEKVEEVIEKKDPLYDYIIQFDNNKEVEADFDIY